MLLEVMGLVLGVPVMLVGLMMLLARFEDSLVQPGERAAKLVEMLQSSNPPEDVERAAAKMLEVCAPVTPRERVSSAPSRARPGTA
jgi:hypothetical protein